MLRAIACLLLLSGCSKKAQPPAEDSPAAVPPTVVAEPERRAVVEDAGPPPVAAPPQVVPVDAGSAPLEVIDVAPTPTAPRPDEAAWRKRFREAHERVDGFDQRLAKAQEIVNASDYATAVRMGSELRVPMPEGYPEAKRLVDNADAERQAGVTALEDLEREAANAGIPLEWRR